jgi:hypothetical protein
VEANNELEGLFDDADRKGKPDMFSFPLFLMNDGNFPRDNASLNLYSEFYSFVNIPLPDEGHYEIYTTRHVLSLRIRHITAETFKYYRALALQSNGMGFFSEPVNIAGNIENGYGIFSVYNTNDLLLLDYERKFPFYVGPEY